MYLLLSFATLALSSAGPQQARDHQHTEAEQSKLVSELKPAAEAKRRVIACRRAAGKVDIGTSTYRDANGKRHRCTR